MLLYLLLLILSLVWVSLQGGTLPYLTFYTLLMIPAGSAAYLFYVCRALRFYQGPSSHLVTRSEGFSFLIILENTGPLPIVSLRLVMEKELCSFLNFDDSRTWSLDPGARLEFSPEMVCLFAGAYPAGAKEFVIRDCFGLFSYTGRIPMTWRAVVRPQITGCADALLDMEQVRTAMELHAPSREAILGSDLREYQRGDSLRHVHWKNSARSETLLVRRPEPRQMEQIHILLLPEAMDKESDPHSERLHTSQKKSSSGSRNPSHRSDTDVSASEAFSDKLSHIRRRDRFLELTVSIADYFCRQNQSVIFWYPQEGMREMAVDSYESFRKFYEQIPELLSVSDRFSSSGDSGHVSGTGTSGGSGRFFSSGNSGINAPDWKAWLSAHGAGEDGAVLLLDEKHIEDNPLTVWHT